MRKILIILSLICLCNIVCTAQIFISETKHWSILAMEASSGEELWKKTFYYKFSGDTLVNQTEYKKLYESEDNLMANWHLNSLWLERNDSVFKYSEYTKQNILLYDFNLTEKDSFCNQINNEYLFVDSVRTKQWGDKLRKHIYLSSKNHNELQTIWRQGVGQNGLITRSTEIGIAGAFVEILCFYENSEQVYQNAKYDNCYIITSSIFDSIVDTTKMWVVFSQNIGMELTGHSIAYKITDSVKMDDDNYWFRVVESQDSLYDNWKTNGFLREQNNITYYKPNKTSDEAMIISDFNKKTGDTIFMDITHEENYFVIDSVKQIFIAGKYRSTQFGKLCSNKNEQIIEGIGSTSGIFHNAFSGCSTGGSYKLQCYLENSETLYHNPQFSSCYVNIPMHKAELSKNNNIHIYPNPTNGKLFIVFDKPSSFTDYKFRIFNTLGQPLFEQKVTHNNIELNISFLPNGEYIYQISNEQKILISDQLILKQ